MPVAFRGVVAGGGGDGGPGAIPTVCQWFGSCLKVIHYSSVAMDIADVLSRSILLRYHRSFTVYFPIG